MSVMGMQPTQTSQPDQPPAGELLAVEGLRKSYRNGATLTPAIGDLTFTLGQGEFLSIVGPSGCGKTSLLRCLSGLQPADAGQRRVHGNPCNGIPEGLSIVFQEYNRSLFPWLSVERNVRFPLHGLPRAQQRERATEALAMVGLAGFENHYPWQLSGGMQQRVGIARGIASRPELLLMDEPFASVDAQTRIALETTLLTLWQELGLSIIFVTHDIDEAVFLSDRVLVLSERPSSILAEVPIDLPRPRDPLATKGLARFNELRREVFAHLPGGAGGPNTALTS